MKFINHVIILFASSLIGLLIANHFVVGFSVSTNIKALIVVSTALMLINVFIRPILRIALSPVILLTFGLGIIIVNAALLWLLAYLFPTYVVISSIKALLFATLIVSFVNMVITFSAKSVLRKEV